MRSYPIPQARLRHENTPQSSVQTEEQWPIFCTNPPSQVPGLSRRNPSAVAEAKEPLNAPSVFAPIPQQVWTIQQDSPPEQRDND